MDYYIKVAKVCRGELEIQDGVLEDILPDILVEDLTPGHNWVYSTKDEIPACLDDDIITTSTSLREILWTIGNGEWVSAISLKTLKDKYGVAVDYIVNTIRETYGTEDVFLLIVEGSRFLEDVGNFIYKYNKEFADLRGKVNVKENFGFVDFQPNILFDCSPSQYINNYINIMYRSTIQSLQPLFKNFVYHGDENFFEAKKEESPLMSVKVKGNFKSIYKQVEEAVKGAFPNFMMYESSNVADDIAYLIDRVYKYYVTPFNPEDSVATISVKDGRVTIQYKEFNDYTVLGNINNLEKGVSDSTGGMRALIDHFPNLLESLDVKEEVNGVDRKISFYLGADKDYRFSTQLFLDPSCMVPIINVVDKIFFESMQQGLVANKFFFEEIITNILFHSRKLEEREYEVVLNKDSSLYVKEV